MTTKIWPEKKIVAIGGGSGISTILSGIKKYTSKVSAIISVSDNGGSTGRLRNDLGIIAPGDIRNCLVSLANTDTYMKKLFDYRFPEGELKGHCFGNIFLAALDGVFNDFGKAIYKTGEILSITGKVYPLTLENTSLIAQLENGMIVRGESQIPEFSQEQKSRISRVFLDPYEVELYEDSKKDIESADLIILGPGSLYTSILPNLLAKDMVDLIEKSSAKVVYVVNVVTQKGETGGYSIKDHYDAVIKHSKKSIVDAIIVNNGKVDKELVDKYEKTGGELLYLNDEERKFFKENNIDIIEEDFIRIIDNQIRHNADKLSEMLINYI